MSTEMLLNSPPVPPLHPTYRPRKRTDYIILHDSHTPPSLKHVQQYLAVKGRSMGLLGIGYHVMVERDGTCVYPRPPSVVGSHAPLLNDRSIGVCLIGGRTEAGDAADNFTTEQLEALVENVIEPLHILYPEAKLVAHSEVHRMKHPCPCLDMAALRSCLQAPRLHNGGR